MEELFRERYRILSPATNVLFLPCPLKFSAAAAAVVVVVVVVVVVLVVVAEVLEMRKNRQPRMVFLRMELF
jgi:hypothetical protein